MLTELIKEAATEEEAKAAGELAVNTAKALRLDGYCRVDMILDKYTGNFVCLEANALPGMTPTSLLPQEAAAAGIEYDELCDMIVKQCRMQSAECRMKELSKANLP